MNIYNNNNNKLKPTDTLIGDLNFDESCCFSCCDCQILRDTQPFGISLFGFART